jgi:hypothetical protein
VEPIAIVAGSVILMIGTVFALGIAIASGRIDHEREEYAGLPQ